MHIIKTTYVYLISFVTLIMMIGGGVGIFFSLSDIVAPDPYYQTFDEYKHMLNYDKTGTFNEEELKRDYDQIVADYKEKSRLRAFNSLIKSFGWVLVPLPFFLYAQRRMKAMKN